MRKYGRSEKFMRGSLLRPLTAIGTVLSVLGAAQAADAASTRGYVISGFGLAMYNIDAKDECPNGMNDDPTQLLTKILREDGKTGSEIEKGINPDTLDMYVFGELATFRGRIDGKPVDVYLHPLSKTEEMKIAGGKQGIGFN